MRNKSPEQIAADRRHKEHMHARLKFLLQDLKVPPSVMAGDVYVVRDWKEAVDKAKKTAASERASVVRITELVHQLERWSNESLRAA